MAKKAISITIDANNLTWLRGRVGASSLRSVSELIDRLITEARSSGPPGPIRSVVGTIDIDTSDPFLDKAADFVWTQLSRSLGRRHVTGSQRKRPSRQRRRIKRRG
jgi:hypothetical protein